MSLRSTHRRDSRLLFANWIAEVDADIRKTIAGLVLAIAAVKAHLIAGVFMELLQAPRAWAIAMSVFIVALTALLAASFL